MSDRSSQPGSGGPVEAAGGASSALAAQRPPSRPRHLPQLIDHAAASEHGVAFYALDRRPHWHSYAALAAAGRKVAAGLINAGVGVGDRVALVLETSPEFFAGWFGALQAGAVPACLYPPVRLGRLKDYHLRTAEMIDGIEAAAVVASRRVSRLLGKTREALELDIPFLRVDHLARTRTRLETVADPSPDALAMIQFSSGTTVRPKPVALSHAQLLANLRAMIARFDGDVTRHHTVSWLPLYHDMGLVGAAMLSLLTPTPLTLIRPEHFVARPEVWLQAIGDQRATVTVAPNFAYGLCVDRIKPEVDGSLDLSSLEIALNGAEPVHPSTIARFTERFSQVGLRPEAMTPVYGLAEVGLAVTFSGMSRAAASRTFDADALEVERRVELASRDVGETGRRELTSVGTPLPGYRIAVKDDDGAELLPGQVGTIWISGPSLMTGYYNQPEITADTLHDGWLDTGDLGFVLDGELYLCGRRKDLLVIRGRNHDPAVVEQAAGEVDGVRKGCVVALAMPIEGEDSEVLMLLVERRAGAAVDDAMIAGMVHKAALDSSGLAAHEVVLLQPGTLPRTSSGKLRRSLAARQYRAGELTPPDRVNWFTMARELFESWLAHRRVQVQGPRKRRSSATLQAVKVDGDPQVSRRRPSSAVIDVSPPDD